MKLDEFKLLPNGIKLYWLQFAERGACVKGMDTDVTVLKRRPYISPRKHTVVSSQWESMGSGKAEVPAQERRLNKGCVGGLLYSVCS